MLREQIEQGKIYFKNCTENLKTEDILEYLNSKSDSDICFGKTDNINEAEYGILIIEEEKAGSIFLVEECAKLLTMQKCIVLVRDILFENYELYKKEPQDKMFSIHPAYQVISLFNENQNNRRWIYTYSSIKEISSIIGKIVLSEYFSLEFVRSDIKIEPKEYFENTLVLTNTGYVKLEGYYIDGFFIHNTGKHRPKLEIVNPVISTVYPHKEVQMKMNFQAPDIAGSFVMYLVIKKKGRILKMDDSIREFFIHVTTEDRYAPYDAILLEEDPPNGKLYTDKYDFKKTWKLKNVSGKDWKKVIFKVKYEHLTHYFCKERKKVYYNIPNGGEVIVSAKFHPPDIPGKYTAFWHLQKEDGTEISTDGPLCCSVVTQYETQSQFEII